MRARFPRASLGALSNDAHDFRNDAIVPCRELKAQCAKIDVGENRILFRQFVQFNGAGAQSRENILLRCINRR